MGETEVDGEAADGGDGPLLVREGPRRTPGGGTPRSTDNENTPGGSKQMIPRVTKVAGRMRAFLGRKKGGLKIHVNKDCGLGNGIEGGKPSPS